MSVTTSSRRDTAFFALLREDARGVWGVAERTALALFVVPFVGGLVVLGSRVDLRAFRLLTDEDRLLEWLQVVGYVGTSVLALLLARRLLRRRSLLLAAGYALLALFCVFVAGEEISWGQRIFDVETPESLERLNRQGELGVHNIGTLETVFQLALLVAGLCGSVGAWLVRSRRLDRRSSILDLVTPPLFLTSFFLVLFLHRLVRFAVPDVTDVTAFVKLGEWPELCFASALLICCVLSLRRLRAEEMPRGRGARA